MPNIDTLLNETRQFHASDAFKAAANYRDPGVYETARADRLAFWAARAQELSWMEPWHTVLEWNRPFAKWFLGGKLNASCNCLDVHLHSTGAKKTALIWEGELGQVRTLTYSELHDEVSRLASGLRDLGLVKGDRVTIYLPMIIEATVAVLACARIGAIHSVVFGGFSAPSLKDRILDSGSKVVITADGGYRRGEIIPLKATVDTALSANDTPVESVIVVRHTGTDVPGHPRDIGYRELCERSAPDCPPEPMDSEDPLFILYTSGTTGTPKGILHTTAGYLVHAKYSTHAVFDLKDSDIYWCTADVGWITGHTYGIYGPLSNGATVMIYEGAPDFPKENRFWEIIERHQVTIFYTAPTAIRTFMKWGEHHPVNHDLSSLRLLGSVGEPINPEAWIWYHTHIGGTRCPIVDTWWQTETGGIMISNLAGLNPMKPGSAGLPLPGIEVAVVSEDGQIVQNGGGLLTITEPWPSMLRGIWGDTDRYKSVYWAPLATYFSGDGATIDDDGYVRVLGRVDDVLNVAGHRIGTMEVESALVGCEGVAEAAVVGMPDAIKGQAILAFVILKEGKSPSDALAKFLIQSVGATIGAIAKPSRIIFTPELPKTRSGKIMRRILKNLAEGQGPGDVTTLANPAIVGDLAGKI